VTLTGDQLVILSDTLKTMVERAAECATMAVKVNGLLKQAAEVTASAATLATHQCADGVKLLQLLAEVGKT